MTVENEHHLMTVIAHVDSLSSYYCPLVCTAQRFFSHSRLHPHRSKLLWKITWSSHVWPQTEAFFLQGAWSFSQSAAESAGAGRDVWGKMGRLPGTVCLWKIGQDFSPWALFFCYLWELFAHVISIKAFVIYTSLPEGGKQTNRNLLFRFVRPWTCLEGTLPVSYTSSQKYSFDWKKKMIIQSRI